MNFSLITKKNLPKLGLIIRDADDSVVIARGMVVGEVEEGTGVNGDGQRLDLHWWTHEYSAHMICCGIVHLDAV